jgi:hypothetical protein
MLRTGTSQCSFEVRWSISTLGSQPGEDEMFQSSSLRCRQLAKVHQLALFVLFVYAFQQMFVETITLLSLS